MNNILRNRYLCVFLLVLLVGCASPVEPDPHGRDVWPDRLMSRGGLYYEHARDLALRLQPAMNQEQVEHILGRPDYTRLEGRALQWVYRWGGSVDVARLVVVFSPVQSGPWLVHRWAWD